MPRVYLPLLPLPVLAVVVAVSACSKARTEETSHVIPPPPSLFAPPPEAKPSPVGAVAARPDDEPSADDVREFQRRVPK